ncbi:hypothetical protein FKR81_26030 [Lentzea tibetensis]|uniref:Streptomyces killer toxin-like beta/gamma crystallin domain-containing protein n=1 Tax=Lentzea tibetensis TaxID=2591470 RepID=A0A563EP02_9PSEU|nr:hypothetical protein [Lentzea tibetensis]TWP49128.1 hypothetical protein FKR81_26030 [Lentzea tibetensis]
MATALTAVMAVPAYAADVVPCKPWHTHYWFKIETTSGWFCVEGRGRAEFRMGGVKQVRTGNNTGAYDYIDTDGYMTTRYFGKFQAHDLNYVQFNSVYID